MERTARKGSIPGQGQDDLWAEEPKSFLSMQYILGHWITTVRKNSFVRSGDLGGLSRRVAILARQSVSALQRPPPVIVLVWHFREWVAVTSDNG
jgi:hypothetical protein